MEKRCLALRDGKKIYVQIYDNGHKNHIVILHGGPGEGSIDFQYQANKLSEHFNVIIFDQRGVLRSDKINGGEQFGLDLLVDDCEDLKNLLGIKSWYVLGHSFGGEIALLYAVKYKNSVKKVIFECPTFYYPMSILSISNKSIKIARQVGMNEFADEIQNYIDNTKDISLLTENMRRIARVTSKFSRKIEIPVEVEKINSVENISDSLWENGQIHFRRLQEDGKMNENMMPYLSKLECSSMLILGKYDPVCTVEHQEYYSNYATGGKMIMFENSDHRPHNEEPDKFLQLILQFCSD